MITFTKMASTLAELKNQLHLEVTEILGDYWRDCREIHWVEGLTTTEGESAYFTPEELQLMRIINRFINAGDCPDDVKKLSDIKNKYFPEGNWLAGNDY